MFLHDEANSSSGNLLRHACCLRPMYCSCLAQLLHHSWQSKCSATPWLHSAISNISDILICLQSMVWCNELVVLLANLLQTIAQTETLKLHNQGLAQQHIVQQMQDATQPKIASTLGWLQTSNRLSTLAANDNLQKQRSAASTCSEQHSGIESGQQVTDGQLLVINQMSGQQCSDR